MIAYHCYFGSRKRLCKKVDLEAADDAFAIIEAERILSNTRQEVMEVWRGTRLIGRQCAATVAHGHGSGASK